MKKMTQHGRGYSRHHNKRKKVPHPRTDWIHAGNSLPSNLTTADFDDVRTLGPLLACPPF